MEKKTKPEIKSGKKEATKERSKEKKQRPKEKDMGFNVKPPSSACTDSKCPFHGDLKVRGRTFTGIVFRSRAQKTAIVVWQRRHYIPKYERYEKRRTKLHVHNPPCINAEEGDIVRIMECRPLSKTKHFVIVEKLGRTELKKPEEETPEKEASQEKKKEKEERGMKKPEEKQKAEGM